MKGCKEKNSVGQHLVQSVHGSKRTDPHVFEIKGLLFKAEIFFDAPPAEVKPKNPHHIFLGTNRAVGTQHHRMFPQPVDENQPHRFFRSSNLYIQMRKPALLLLPLKEYGRLEFPFACGAECRSGNPLAFDEELPFGRKANHIVLLEAVHVEKELIGIIAAIEDKDSTLSQVLSQKADAGTGNGIDRGKFFSAEE